MEKADDSEYLLTVGSFSQNYIIKEILGKSAIRSYNLIYNVLYDNTRDVEGLEDLENETLIFLKNKV